MMNYFYRNSILPRLIFLFYYPAKLVLFLICIIQNLIFIRKTKKLKTHICIEAGVKGWQSIEFKELYQSACEYLTPEDVHQLVIQPNVGYIKQILNLLRSKSITHYVYDPRTGSQNTWVGLWQSFIISIILEKFKVTPIVLLTDLSTRSWRTQSAILTARKGVVICFISSKSIRQIFPHKRIIGPSLMPFSRATLNMLDEIIEKRPKNTPSVALFIGSLYEPRITRLENISSSLKKRDQSLEIIGRSAGGARVPDSEYWSRMCYADIVITTADQIANKATDWTHIPQLVYRYLEVLACGSLLIAQDVPGVRKYFIPGKHFVSFETNEEAAELISYYLTNESERNLIAAEGKKRANELISSHSYWLLIDSLLGPDSLN